MPRRLNVIVVLGLLATTQAHGDEGPAYPPDSPRFSRHVIPLFSRLGCNAGTCHGKVKGENGFRLSLFGVDPKQDHGGLVQEFAARRVNLSNVEASLLLLKPTGAIPHGGGKLIEAGSPEYQILQRWLEQGAKLDPLEESRITEFTVTPNRQTVKVGEKYPLRVQVKFSDGTSEDVTRLCRYEAVDPEVVTISAQGEVEAHSVGDTAIIVRFGADPVVAQVMVPGEKVEFPQVSEGNPIDGHVLAKLRTLNVPPAEVCDDATFLRRASLDITGAPPQPEEIRAFLADSRADKRARKIDELLARPGHTALWAMKFCDILRPSDFNHNFAFYESAENRRFYQWIRARLEENIPYDEFAARILTATSREGRSYEQWIDEVLALAEENARQSADLPTYAKRRTLDLYWQRKEATGVKGTVQVAHAFLGLRMECAQCHRHPHDVWSQDDLLSFANFFNQLKGAAYPDKKRMTAPIAKMFEQLPKDAKSLEGKLKDLRDKKLRDVSNRFNKTRDDLNRAKSEKKEAMVKQLEDQLKKLEGEKAKIEQEVAEVEAQRGRMMNGPKRFGTDIVHNAERINHASVSSPLGSQRSEKFRLLGEEKAIEVARDRDPRELVVDWLRKPDNPFFARAIVNRVWAHYFGRGIVDPPDHLSPLNPPSHPELLDELARKFVENRYDLRWLHRTIATSWAYQLSSKPHPLVREKLRGAARRNFGYFQIRRLPAEMLVDAVNHATGSREQYPPQLYMPADARAVEVAGVTRMENQEASLAYAFKIFGRPERNTDVQCDCERDTNTTIVQTLYLANHPLVRQKIYSEGGRVAQIVRDVKENERRIDEIYLVAVGRLPTAGERETCLAYVQKRESSLRAFQDVLWSVLNTKEFILNH